MPSLRHEWVEMKTRQARIVLKKSKLDEKPNHSRRFSGRTDLISKLEEFFILSGGTKECRNPRKAKNKWKSEE